VQWDVKDGPRFDIGHIDGAGRKIPSPVIIHASSFGSVERSLCALLENVAVDERHGLPPTLPYWLSPTQLRLIPVAERHVPHCERLAAVLGRAPARCDVDDREETVGRKIRAAEQDWVPYAVVVGDREAAGEAATVRMRRERESRPFAMDALRELLSEARGGLPFRPLPTKVLVSGNPVFHG
jgi:threonyl-tRNA synthetase